MTLIVRPLWKPLLLLALACLARPGLSAPVSEAESLQLLSEEQAEAVESLDAVIDNEVQTPYGTKAVTARMVMDKAKGAMKMQQLAPDGRVAMELMVEGSSAYFKRNDGQWQKLPMDAQTQASLEQMGVDFKGEGLAGMGKPEASTAEAQALAGTPAATDEEPGVAQAGAEHPYRLLKRRGADPKRLAKLRARIEKRVRQRAKHQDTERIIGLDEPKQHRRALRLRSKPGQPSAWDQEVQKVDERTGVVMERSRFVARKRWPGGKDKIPKTARRWKEAFPAAAQEPGASGDDELIEVSHSRVLKVRQEKGLAVPEETEAVNHSAAGTTVIRTRWSRMKLNEPVPASEFSRKKGKP